MNKVKEVSSFETKYKEKVQKTLMTAFDLKNVMTCPRLEKIVVNTSVKEAVLDRKVMDKVAADLALITGQQPRLAKAKKSIANFKLREGQAIGCSVTLRRERMYEFFNRLVTVVLPRVRDFRGVSRKGFDGKGNYTMGLTEHTLFPEIAYDKVERVFGMNISFVTSAKSNEEGRALLKEMGMPFRET